MMNAVLKTVGSAKAALLNKLRMRRLYRLAAADDETPFPAPDTACQEPNGLLAIGGRLSPRRLEQAYRQGVFPYFLPGQTPRWWSPDPRAVLFPADIEISTSLRRCIRQGRYRVTVDHCFREVVLACAAPRAYAKATWISAPVIDSYCRLHELGHAHSWEIWRDDRLVGGLYGVSFGAAFFGESMFSRASDASKVGLVHQARQLAARGFHFIDCQFPTPHLARMGAVAIPRREYLRRLERALAASPTQPISDAALLPAREDRVGP